MNELADLLRRRRAELGVSLRSLATRDLSQQSLSNYEGEKSIPSEQKLPILAKRYDIPLDDLRLARVRSIGSQEPVEERLFLHALDFATPGDHLVVVTQNSLIAGRPHLAKKLLQFAKDGMLFTYATYSPMSELTGEAAAIWTSNHDEAAWTLRREATRSGQEQLLDKVHYLCIDNPSAVDFAFLRAFGSLSYLRRSANSDDALPRSRLWSVNESPGGDPWWCPLSPYILHDVDRWLREDCGLLLPSASFDGPQSISPRTVRLFTLEEYLSRRIDRSIH